MIYLALSISASTCILIVFRLMEQFGANTRHAITLNYLFAALTGFLFFKIDLEIVFAPWFWPAAIEGLVFYLVFRVMAMTAQINGVAVASIATKMSVIIPVSFGLFVLNEDVNIAKLLGLAAGLGAVWLSASKSTGLQDWKWPLLAFIGTGFIDTSFKLFQIWSVSEAEFPAFVSTIFGFAFLVGVTHHLTTVDKRVHLASVLSGSLLGVMNFATVYFLLSALAVPNWESSMVFPINNFGVVALSTLAGIVLFRERLSTKGWIGLGLAVISIWLLYRAHT